MAMVVLLILAPYNSWRQTYCQICHLEVTKNHSVFLKEYISERGKYVISIHIILANKKAKEIKAQKKVFEANQIEIIGQKNQAK